MRRKVALQPKLHQLAAQILSAAVREVEIVSSAANVRANELRDDTRL